MVNHHLTEEELTIFNPARGDVSEADRARLGSAFARARNRLIEEDCGELANVRVVVVEAKDHGLLNV